MGPEVEVFDPPALPRLCCHLLASMRCRAARSRSLGQQDRDGGEHQHAGDHRKGIGKAHHQRLTFDAVTERDDGLLMCGGGIRHAMGHEEVGHGSDPVAHLIAIFRQTCRESAETSVFDPTGDISKKLCRTTIRLGSQLQPCG
jgi:hypothetical protein